MEKPCPGRGPQRSSQVPGLREKPPSNFQVDACRAGQETHALLLMAGLVPCPLLLTQDGSPRLCVHWRHKHVPGNETTLGRSHPQDAGHPAWDCTYRPWKDGEKSLGNNVATSPLLLEAKKGEVDGQQKVKNHVWEQPVLLKGTPDVYNAGDELGEAGGWVRPESQAPGSSSACSAD